ncbi:hypothetical protein M404DRAFT_533431 [Pisolithus tinctorius Marx 270]|uniref:Uncharacterized protein n=1 Tax=Pisolithus tinctorius Marx 270 TaxID=870435 RepID=A0A0C3PBM3_PISTI|nr:hypothetical protein M404DRAFT_533431 [Pisolithus tinctorius Marx 270]
MAAIPHLQGFTVRVFMFGASIRSLNLGSYSPSTEGLFSRLSGIWLFAELCLLFPIHRKRKCVSSLPELQAIC